MDGLVRHDVKAGDVLAAKLDGPLLGDFVERLGLVPFPAEDGRARGAAIGVGLVVQQAMHVAVVDLFDERRLRPNGNVGKGRIVLFREEGVDDADGEGDGVLPWLARGGEVPLDGGGV